MSTPKVSIGLPVYNGANYLENALDSILSQDFADFEVVISDNASQDETESICRAYAKRDQRIRYFRANANQGAAPNYNRVFELSRGTYFKWAAHDDECLPGFIRRCVETLDQAPSSVVAAYPRAEIIDGNGRVTGLDLDCLETKHCRPHRRLACVLRNVSKANAVFGLIRSDALRKTRLIDRFIASDLVLLAELVMLGEIWEVPEVLSRRRLHPGMSAKGGPMWFKVFTLTAKSRAFWNPLLAWFDPSKKEYTSHFSPFMLLGFEYARSVKRLPLPGWDKFLCYMTIPSVWYVRHFRNVGGLHKQRFKNVFKLSTESPKISGKSNRAEVGTKKELSVP
jgi:glycosyltransferase involved in cell wall biosynthesis